jgi:hypothetical protein
MVRASATRGSSAVTIMMGRLLKNVLALNLWRNAALCQEILFFSGPVVVVYNQRYQSMDTSGYISLLHGWQIP